MRKREAETDGRLDAEETVIDAILKGKVSVTEDLLTSCVVGALATMPRQYGLLAWLEKARPYGAMRQPLNFGTEPAPRVDVIYWPQTANHGEPDVFVMVEDGPVTHAIVLEAKYGASKSDWDTVDAEDLRRDQLVRYWEALRALDLPEVSADRIRGAEKTVVFVTPHGAPPAEELQESVRRRGEIRLAWLSWRDAWDVAEPFRTSTEAPNGWLLTLLEYLGLTQFRGFGLAHDPTVEFSAWHFDRGGFAAAADVAVSLERPWQYSIQEQRS
jgi:hypothetical protein